MSLKSMVGVSFSCTPTLCLKGVDPEVVKAAYLARKYVTAALPETKLVVKATFVPTTPGNHLVFRDRNNRVHTVHLTNDSNVRASSLYKPRCFWCMRDIARNPMPVVYGMARTWSKEQDDDAFSFMGEGAVCSFECNLAYLRHFGYGLGAQARASNQLTGESALHTLFELVYPGEQLHEAPNFRLLVTNGGTMSEDEFENCKHVYEASPVFTYTPVHQQYMSTNLH